MCPLQRERGSFVVIEKCRLPPGRIVTVDTACNSVLLCELFSVNIGVAVFALFRGGAKLRMKQGGFQVRWLVAVDTRYRPMGAGQGKLRLGMIKTRQIFPRLDGMASLTAERLPVRQTLHPLLKLPAMRVFMASLTTQILKVIGHKRLRRRDLLPPRFMTVAAGDC